MRHYIRPVARGWVSIHTHDDDVDSTHRIGSDGRTDRETINRGTGSTRVVA